MSIATDSSEAFEVWLKATDYRPNTWEAGRLSTAWGAGIEYGIEEYRARLEAADCDKHVAKTRARYQKLVEAARDHRCPYSTYDASKISTCATCDALAELDDNGA